MPTCPTCHDTYVDGVTRCADCGVDLVADGEPLPPRIDRTLGKFDPEVADLLVAMLTVRREPHRLVDTVGATQVLVDRDVAEDLRAELFVSWQELINSLPEEARHDLSDGHRPGWQDAPEESWLDRDFRLRVTADEATEATRDNNRQVGASLLAAGTLALLYAWYANTGAWLVVIGLGLVLLGAFLPR